MRDALNGRSAPQSPLAQGRKSIHILQSLAKSFLTGRHWYNLSSLLNCLQIRLGSWGKSCWVNHSESKTISQESLCLIYRLKWDGSRWLLFCDILFFHHSRIIFFTLPNFHCIRFIIKKFDLACFVNNYNLNLWTGMGLGKILFFIAAPIGGMTVAAFSLKK